MTPPTEKPFEPTREQLQEQLATCQMFLEATATCRDELIADLSTLRSQLDAANYELLLKSVRCADDSLKIHDLNSQLDALKAQVVVGRDALKLVEYSATWNNGRKDIDVCPACEQSKGYGHDDGCKLGLALTQLEAK